MTAASTSKPVAPHLIQVAPCRPNEPFTPPTYSHPDDVGLDFAISRPIMVYPGSFAIAATNVAIALPHGMWALLIGRSSTFYRKHLLVNTAVIDHSFRGEVSAMVWNPGQDRIQIREGERIFQLLLHNRVSRDIVTLPAWDDLPPGDRGQSGFGSTGGMDPDPGSLPIKSTTYRDNLDNLERE